MAFSFSQVTLLDKFRKLLLMKKAKKFSCRNLNKGTDGIRQKGFTNFQISVSTHQKSLHLLIVETYKEKAGLNFSCVGHFQGKWIKM